MSHFECEKCGTICYDSPRGYTTGCEHYPADISPDILKLPESGSKLILKQIQCVSVKNTAITQSDCLMFGLDDEGQMWEKRLQDSTWTRTPMRKQE